MPRRPTKSDTPLDQKQADLTTQEKELREKMRKLEQMIADAPRAAEEKSREQREELVRRANEGERRLDVSTVLFDKRYGDVDYRPRRRSLRKERREGRIVFIVLVIVLAAAVFWLLTHLKF